MNNDHIRQLRLKHKLKSCNWILLYLPNECIRYGMVNLSLDCETDISHPLVTEPSNALSVDHKSQPLLVQLLGAH